MCLASIIASALTSVLTNALATLLSSVLTIMLASVLASFIVSVLAQLERLVSADNGDIMLNGHVLYGVLARLENLHPADIMVSEC